MFSKEKYNFALSFWTVSDQYLRLVENVAREITKQGNIWFMIKDRPITLDEYMEETRWSDHVLIIPLLFNLYHGIELLLKGFLLIASGQDVKPKHGIDKLCHQFSIFYPDETVIFTFIRKFTDEECLPPLLKDFLHENGLKPYDLYKAVRYPSDKNFQKVYKYIDLKYKGEKGLLFFKELVEDIMKIRIASIKLGRSLEPQEVSYKPDDLLGLRIEKE
jgi:hypothetical protein